MSTGVILLIFTLVVWAVTGKPPEYFNNSDQDPIVLSVWLHHQITVLHPFSDGNGRTARLLQDWVLQKEGYFAVSTGHIKRSQYLDFLEDADKDEFDEDKLSSEEHRQVQKFLLIFFLGQILDLPTLNSMLEQYEISSNSVSKHYAEIQSKISTKNILRLYERIFEHQLSEHLLTLFEKHPCIFSRNLVTVVLDDSVFKQWLSSFIEGEDFEGCYGKYFSGQTKSSVYAVSYTHLTLPTILLV